MARVGWLGLGAMGLPMARRLVEASHDVAAYDPMPASLEAVAAAGGPPGSAAGAGAGRARAAVRYGRPAGPGDGGPVRPEWRRRAARGRRDGDRYEHHRPGGG